MSYDFCRYIIFIRILVRAYALKDGSFDRLLIAYLRHTLAIYTENVKELLPDDEQKEIINTNIFNSYSIESFNIEPSFLALCCFQYLFDIKINLTYLQGELKNPEQRNINLVGEEGDCPFINIGFFYSSYHKLYPKNFELNYNYNLPVYKPLNRQLTYILKDTKLCDECHKNTEHILFIEKKFIVCKICLENILSKICTFRSDSFEKDGFLGVEYYTRPINLEGSYYIDEYEIIELLESVNILETLIQKYVGLVCQNCHKKEENTIELKCGCEFCKECLIDIVLNKTKGIRVLIEFEKQQLKNSKCSCGKPFDFDVGLKYVPKKEKDKSDSLYRLKNYVNTLCLICTKELRTENGEKGKYINIEDESKFKKIKMKKMNGKGLEGEIYESDHLICDDCYRTYLKRKIEIGDDDEEDAKNDYFDFEKEIVNCSICCKRHLFRVTQNEACCANDCIIY